MEQRFQFRIVDTVVLMFSLRTLHTHLNSQFGNGFPTRSCTEIKSLETDAAHSVLSYCMAAHCREMGPGRLAYILVTYSNMHVTHTIHPKLHRSDHELTNPT